MFSTLLSYIFTSLTNNEWAVNCIKNYSGTKTDVIFEVHWKLGDITWLPYYQITHLQALTDYLDLIGVSQISNGSGWPPADDPQVFLGSISFISPLNSSLDKLLSLPIITNARLLFKQLCQTICTMFLPASSVTSHIITTDLEPPLTMPSHCNTNHPYSGSQNHPNVLSLDGLDAE